MRYTPAGVPVSEATLQHASEVMEAGQVRRIELQVTVRALGEAARWLDAAEFGKPVEITGFLAQKSMKSRLFVLHVNTLKFLEGN
jgi:primosomal replication protein N